MSYRTGFHDSNDVNRIGLTTGYFGAIIRPGELNEISHASVMLAATRFMDERQLQRVVYDPLFRI